MTDAEVEGFLRDRIVPYLELVVRAIPPATRLRFFSDPQPDNHDWETQTVWQSRIDPLLRDQRVDSRTYRAAVAAVGEFSLEILYPEERKALLARIAEKFPDEVK